MQEYGRFLNRELGRGEIPMRIRYIPLPFDRLPEALLAGFGDVIAAQLTVTPGQATQLAFTEPYLKDVNEVVVGHEGGPARGNRCRSRRVGVPCAGRQQLSRPPARPQRARFAPTVSTP